MGAASGKVKPVQIYDNQSVEVEGEDHVRRSQFASDFGPVGLEGQDCQTLYDALRAGYRHSPNGKAECLGWRPGPDEPYKWMSYIEVRARCRSVGSGLISLGIQAANTTHIGIYSQNRPEYFIVEQACYEFSMCIVPLYDTLSEEACIHIINQAELEVLVCDKLSKVSSLLKRAAETPNLKTIVVMENISNTHAQLAEQSHVQLIQFSEMEAIGRSDLQKPNPCKSTDHAVISYTSGTTGVPKGAILTHAGILTCSLAVIQSLGAGGIHICAKDTLISYLPLAHVYERMFEVCIYKLGGRIGYFQGDVTKLLADVQELKPTIFCGVPRVLNKIYDKITASVKASKLKSWLFAKALAAKEKKIKMGIIERDLWDKFVFKKVQASLGGCVRLMLTGAAPLADNVLTFLRCVMGCPIVEGYGQTESCGLISAMLVGDPGTGANNQEPEEYEPPSPEVAQSLQPSGLNYHQPISDQDFKRTVGPPVVCNFVKLVDIPDMNCFAKDGKGEVCVKGPNVFEGYLKDPEKTSEAMDSDGWLRTGDVGQWLPNGSLKLIDRKKNLFKLAQGEMNIAPEKIENIYATSYLIAQAFVYGDPFKPCVVAVIVPNPDVLPSFARVKLGLTGSVASLCKEQALKTALMEELALLGEQLFPFERAKAIHLHPEMFTIENGLLTPTFKAKRAELKAHFETEIDNLYKDLM